MQSIGYDSQVVKPAAIRSDDYRELLPNFLSKSNWSSFSESIEIEIVPTQHGKLYCIISACLHIVSAILCRALSDMSVAQVLFFRSFLLASSFIAYQYYTNRISHIIHNISFRMLFVSFSYSMCNYLFYTAVRELCMFELVTIFSAAVIFNCFFSYIFYSEPYSNIEKLLGVVSVIGTVLIVRPHHFFENYDDNSHRTGMQLPHYSAGLLAVLSTALYSVTQVTLKKLKSDLDPLSVFLSMNGLGVVWYALYFLVFGFDGTITALGALGIVGMAISSGFTAFFAIKGLKNEEPRMASLLSYTQLGFAVIADVIFYGDFPPGLSVVGAILVVGSCLYLIKRNMESKVEY